MRGWESSDQPEQMAAPGSGELLASPWAAASAGAGVWASGAAVTGPAPEPFHLLRQEVFSSPDIPSWG